MEKPKNSEVDIDAVCSKELQDTYQSSLSYIQELLELNLSSIEIIKHEDVWDEDKEEIVRVLTLNRGTSTYYLCVTPRGFWKSMDLDIPSNLLMDIHNVLMTIFWEAYDGLDPDYDFDDEE